MGLFEQFPYQNFHELNLDWLIQQLNMIKDSVVLSVNGQTGEVILYPEALVRLPDLSDTTTWAFFRYVDSKAEGVQFIKGQPMQRIDDLHRYDIYDTGNPPPYPVTAVNGQTGDVVISVPVQSVNGLTGNIILYQNASIEFPAINTDSWEMWRETNTNQALGVKFDAGQPMKRVDNGLEYTVYDSQNQPPYPVESVAGLTGAVAILNTQIVTDQGQQKIQIVFPVNSVDGQTGSVNTWGYTNNATTKLPLAAPADLWNLTRDINSGTVGLRFTYDSVNGSQAYLTFNDGTNPETALRLLTPADIPSSSGVVSINGMAGVVDLYADNIQMSSNDNTLVEDAISNNAADITDIQGDITNIEGDITNLQADVLSNSQSIEKTQHGLAYIVGNTNTTGNTLAVGQFVYVKGHSTIAEGLRIVTASISANGNITTSNTSSCSEGGLNALNSNKMNSTIDTTIQSVDLLAQGQGAYRYNSNCSNIPSIESGFMQMTQRDSTTKVATVVTNSGKMFTNVMSGGTWTGWKELAIVSNIGLISGNNDLGGVICPGYNTGSGNYVDFFIPINTNGKTVTSVTADSDSVIFLPSGRADFVTAPTITISATLQNGVRCEIQYPSTQAPNVCASIYLVNLKIVCS